MESRKMVLMNLSVAAMGIQKTDLGHGRCGEDELRGEGMMN